MKTLSSLTFLLVLAVGLSALAAEKYTEEDLAALIESQSYAEALNHMKDVRPSQRSRKWGELLEEAAAGQLDHLQRLKQCPDAWQLSETLLKEHPILSSSKSFLIKRREIGTCAAAEAQDQQYPAIRPGEIIKRIEATDSSEETKYYLATNENYRWTSYLLELMEKNPKKYRKDPKVKEYLAKQVKSNLRRDFGKRIKAMISQYLFSELEKDLNEALEGESQYGRDMAFAILSEKGKLPDRYAARFHLENFFGGSTFQQEKFEDALAYLKKKSKKDMTSFVAAYFAQEKIRFEPWEGKKYEEKVDQILAQTLPDAITLAGKECTTKESKVGWEDCKDLYRHFGRGDLISQKDREGYANRRLQQAVKSGQYNPKDETLILSLEIEARSTEKANQSATFMEFVKMLDADIKKWEDVLAYGSFGYGETKADVSDKLDHLRGLREDTVSRLLK